mmetsp:Transcript_45766/g.106274  ORF Transcript_45766/g.106274 Transcript_45766/m.106274 type:complete len:241 (-) Transcript_45766:764-1486(-)
MPLACSRTPCKYSNASSTDVSTAGALLEVDVLTDQSVSLLDVVVLGVLSARTVSESRLPLTLLRSAVVASVVKATAAACSSAALARACFKYASCLSNSSHACCGEAYGTVTFGIAVTSVSCLGVSQESLRSGAIGLVTASKLVLPQGLALRIGVGELLMLPPAPRPSEFGMAAFAACAVVPEMTQEWRAAASLLKRSSRPRSSWPMKLMMVGDADGSSRYCCQLRTISSIRSMLQSLKGL